MGTYVIAVGGSLIVPEEINLTFLHAFKQLILKRVEKGDKFILVAGGGKIARKYRDAAAELGEIDNEEKDWLGIHCTRLNAHLLRTIFKQDAFPRLFKSFDDPLNAFKEPILIGAGMKPGRSSDFPAVFLAKRFSASHVINLSNIEYVYTEDPRLNPEAEKFSKISWKRYLDIIGTRWDPGMSAPFDPVASKEAMDNNIKVAMVNGSKLSNLEKFFDGEEFGGTLIGSEEDIKIN